MSNLFCLFVAVIAIMQNFRLGFSFTSAAHLMHKVSSIKRSPLSTISSSYVASELQSIHFGGAASGPSSSAKSTSQVLVVPLFKEGRPSADELSPHVQQLIADCLEGKSFTADADSKHVMGIGGGKHLALLGLGDASSYSAASAADELSVRIGKATASIANELKCPSLDIVFPLESKKLGMNMDKFIHSIYDGCYVDNRFRKTPVRGGENSTVLRAVTVLGCSDEIRAALVEANKVATHVSSAVKFAKDLVSAPANIATPVVISELCRQMCEDHGMTFALLQEKECRARGMGGYLGVQQGSKFPPQFVHMTYKPPPLSSSTTGNNKPVRKVALVGKGLTFDSGGYNLKVGASQIEMMKVDMGGCAAVLGAAKAIAQLRPEGVEVHFITALCENMVNEHAMRPGDVLEASNGKTIEVINTDAEGRLTLADALVYAEQLGVDEIVDLATLTGACVVGLGEDIAAVYSDDNALANALLSSSAKTTDKLWRMPLDKEYKRIIKSDIADVANAGERWGGSITAALFLQEFVTNKVKWAHIDMAGPVWDGRKKQPTGYGVRLLTDYVINGGKKSE